MMPYIVDSPPWLKNKPLPVPEAMHHYYMAQSYVASIANNRALRELEQAIRLDPTNPKFYVLQTKILLDQDKSVEGSKAALAAMERSRDTTSDILALSDEFYLPEAKIVYSKAIEMGNREVLPYLGLGNIALHSGDVVEAEKWFVPAREIQADHPAVLLAFGRLALVKGNQEKDKQAASNFFQEAKGFVGKVQKQRRGLSYALFGIGRGLCETEHVGQSRRIIQRSVANEAEKKRLASLSGRSLRETRQSAGGRTEIPRGFGFEPR